MAKSSCWWAFRSRWIGIWLSKPKVRAGCLELQSSQWGHTLGAQGSLKSCRNLAPHRPTRLGMWPLAWPTIVSCPDIITLCLALAKFQKGWSLSCTSLSFLLSLYLSNGWNLPSVTHAGCPVLVKAKLLQLHWSRYSSWTEWFSILTLFLTILILRLWPNRWRYRLGSSTGTCCDDKPNAFIHNILRESSNRIHSMYLTALKWIIILDPFNYVLCFLAKVKVCVKWQSNSFKINNSFSSL